MWISSQRFLLKEMLLEKAKAIRKENAAFTKIEELETQLSETRRILLVEKEMAHEKVHTFLKCGRH